MTHEEIVELAPQYVLGELDEVTSARVASHLKTCDVCRGEVRAHAEVLDALGRDVPAVDPPAHLRERIMHIPQQRPNVSPRVVPVRRPTPWLVALAASLVAAVATWQGWSAAREAARLRDDLGALRESAAASDAARAALLREVADNDRIMSVLRSAGVMRFDLTGLAPAPAARARAFVNPRDAMVMIAEGLPALPANMIYQIWAIVGSTPISLGTMVPDATGRAHGLMALPATVGRPDVVAVTIEPAPGVPSPTGAIYLKTAPQ